MRARLWNLVEGPEWADSIRAAQAAVQRFDENLEALVDAIGVDPFAYGRAFIQEADDVRYSTTKDVANGYRLVMFYKVDRPSTTCELGWLEVEWL